jgi:hypothetical protein
MDLGIERLELLLGARRGIAIDEGAVLDPHAVEGEREPARAGAALVRGLARRRGRLAGGRDLPVPMPVGQLLEENRRLHQRQAGDLDLAAQERHQRDADIEGFERRHVGGAAAFGIGEAHPLDRQLRRRQQRQRDVAIDAEIAPRRLARLGFDLRLVPVPVDEARHHQDGSDRQHQEGTDCDQDFLRHFDSRAGWECRGRALPFRARWLCARLAS